MPRGWTKMNNSLVNNISSINEYKALFPHPDLNLFSSTHHPYYFFSQEYMQTSAGTRAPYQLCHLLNDLGYEAYVISDVLVEGLRTPILTNEIMMKHKAEGRHPIAVYNETAFGNPLEADIVVRWILNRTVYVDGKPIPFLPDDLIFYWDIIFANKNKCTELQVFTENTNIFNTINMDESKRTGFCYYAHKYLASDKGKSKLPEILTKNGISLCQDIKRSPSEIADILRRSKVLFCYEPSAIGSEAVLCGCQLIFIDSEYIREFSIVDIKAISEDEIDIVNPLKHVDSDYYNSIIKYKQGLASKYSDQIKFFIEITQGAANKCKQKNSKADRLRKFCENYPQLYIYGGGVIARQCYRTLKILNIKIDGFIVSDSYKNVQAEKNSLQEKIYTLSEIEGQKDKCGIILAMSIENEDDVIKILDEHKFKNYIRHSLLCPAVGRR